MSARVNHYGAAAVGQPLAHNDVFSDVQLACDALVKAALNPSTPRSEFAELIGKFRAAGQIAGANQKQQEMIITDATKKYNEVRTSKFFAQAKTAHLAVSEAAKKIETSCEDLAVLIQDYRTAAEKAKIGEEAINSRVDKVVKSYLENQAKEIEKQLNTAQQTLGKILPSLSEQTSLLSKSLKMAKLSDAVHEIVQGIHQGILSPMSQDLQNDYDTTTQNLKTIQDKLSGLEQLRGRVTLKLSCEKELGTIAKLTEVAKKTLTNFQEIQPARIFDKNTRKLCRDFSMQMTAYEEIQREFEATARPTFRQCQTLAETALALKATSEELLKTASFEPRRDADKDGALFKNLEKSINAASEMEEEIIKEIEEQLNAIAQNATPREHREGENALRAQLEALHLEIIYIHMYHDNEVGSRLWEYYHKAEGALDKSCESSLGRISDFFARIFCALFAYGFGRRRED